MKLKISLCEYRGGDFDFFFEGETGEIFSITAPAKFTKEDREFIMKYFPPCVMTTYKMDEK